MRHFHAPEVVAPEFLARSVFLAGGITGAPLWQSELAASLDDLDVSLLDPRREDYNALDPRALRQQIGWEHAHLRAASAISFWFPKDAPCLISLFELGAWSHFRDHRGRAKPLFVGVEDGYIRRENLQIQLEIERPETQIVTTLSDLAAQIRSWCAGATP